jgi:fructose-1,6-bisphosphatase/inositol monophosphatase family enzyme
VGVLSAAFPAHRIVGEEGTAEGGDDEHVWLVDPLDGTTNYAHGLPIFAVSIALERAGEVVLRVVHDPMREETFIAERGGGATLIDGTGAVRAVPDDPLRLIRAFPVHRIALVLDDTGMVGRCLSPLAPGS